MRLAQDDLFGPARALPPGFAYRAGAVSPEQESALLEWFSTLPFREFEFHGYRGRRRVTYFGTRYDFNESRLRPAEPMPAQLLPLRTIAAEFGGLDVDALQHALVTEYTQGAGIGWHRDRPDFDDVIGFSFGAICSLRLRRRMPAGWDRVAAQLEPRSVYLLRGAVRSEWEHSIAPMATLRYSVTFRSLRRP